MNNILQFWKQRHLGLWLILSINLGLFVDYLIDHDRASVIVLLFWFQSIFLAFENVLKMLFCKTGEPIIVNNKEQVTGIGTNIFMAMFFLIHHGIFIVFFGAMAILNKQNFHGLFSHTKFLGTAALLMLVAMLIELPGKIRSVMLKSPGLSKLMFLPYIRLMPFVVLILGSEMNQALVFPLFMILKSGVDVVYYLFVDQRHEKNAQASIL